MHRIDANNVAADFLVHVNTAYYGFYKRGIEAYPDDYEDDLALESALIDQAMATRGIKKPDDYIKDCNEKLQMKIQEANAVFSEAPPAPSDGVRHIPASQEDASGAGCA